MLSDCNFLYKNEVVDIRHRVRRHLGIFSWRMHINSYITNLTSSFYLASGDLDFLKDG